MREQHNGSGPGKPRKWSCSNSGDWIRDKSAKETHPKRRADGNISPADKDSTKKVTAMMKNSPSKASK